MAEQLSDVVRASAIERLGDRINAAREALGRPAGGLEKAEPYSCGHCVLAHNLDVQAWPEYVRVDSEEDAELIAEVWETSCEESNGASDSWLVYLPIDLRLITQAFDACQLPELIDLDRPHAVRIEGISEMAMRSTLGIPFSDNQLAQIALLS